MRNIRGYTFLSQFEGNEREHLFGKNPDESADGLSYCDFESNGFMPYAHKKEARAGAEGYISKNSRFSRLDLFQIALNIAEKEDELDSFVRRSNLIVIRYGLSTNTIFGDVVEGKPSYGQLQCAELRDNGYTTFRKSRGKHPFTLACALLSEIKRHDSKVTIAQLKLKRLESLLPV